MIPGKIAVDDLVDLAQQGDGLQVFPPAELIGLPLALRPAVVVVEHIGNRVHAQAVGMENVQPEHSAGLEERAHLVAPEIEHAGTPLLILTAQRVRALVKRRAVKA